MTSIFSDTLTEDAARALDQFADTAEFEYVDEADEFHYSDDELESELDAEFYEKNDAPAADDAPETGSASQHAKSPLEPLPEVYPAAVLAFVTECRHKRNRWQKLSNQHADGTRAPKTKALTFWIKKEAIEVYDRCAKDASPILAAQHAIAFRTDCTVFLQDASQLTRWRATCQLRQVGSAHRADGAGRKPKFGALNALLWEWWQKHRVQLCERVHVGKLTEAARKIYEDNPRECAADRHTTFSPRWVEGWCQRHAIVERRVKRVSTLSEEEIKRRAQAFHLYVQVNTPHATDGREGWDIIINFDEIPVSCAGRMSSETTLEFRGSRDLFSPEALRNRCRSLGCKAIR